MKFEVRNASRFLLAAGEVKTSSGRINKLAASLSQFSPQQLLFAHAALTNLPNQRLRHDQRVARQGFSRAQAATKDTQVRIGNWHLARSETMEQSAYHAAVRSETAGFGLDITMTTTQPLLLQG